MQSELHVSDLTTQCSDHMRLVDSLTLACHCLFPDTDAIYGTNVVLEWKTSTNWATDADECTWFGITCTSGVVTKVEFICNQLSGSLPEELTLLKDSLSYIDLFDNLVSNKGDEGNAWLGDLTNLEYLYYGTTNFEYNGIPSQISKLTKLIEYDFSYTLYFGELKDGDLKGLNSLAPRPIPSGVGSISQGQKVEWIAKYRLLFGGFPFYPTRTIENHSRLVVQRIEIASMKAR